MGKIHSCGKHQALIHTFALYMSKVVAEKLKQWCPVCLDFHAHFMHPEVYRRCEAHGVASGFGKHIRPISSPRFRGMLDPEVQIADMDERGIDVNVIASVDVIHGRTWAEPPEEAEMAAMVNDMAADWAARYSRRFIGTCSVPLGDMRLGLAELERSVRSGLRVVHLPSNYRGIYLGDERFDDLWAAIAEKKLVVFIHPDGVRDPWFQEYSLWNSIGQSIEEVKVMSHLIYQGIMDRHRGNLKIVMAHGGGYMPYYTGRLDRNVTDKPDTARNLSKKPSEYLRDFYYDTCVYDPRTLEMLVERVGADRLVLGGDYPVGGLDPLDFLESATALTDPQRAAIAGGNAAQLLGLT
jgi:aminocarboxymuconate-semialdehyde decarboxylase